MLARNNKRAEQGYYYSRPIPEDEFLNFLQNKGGELLEA